MLAGSPPVTGKCPAGSLPAGRQEGAQLKRYFLSGKPRLVAAELHLYAHPKKPYLLERFVKIC